MHNAQAVQAGRSAGCRLPVLIKFCFSIRFEEDLMREGLETITTL